MGRTNRCDGRKTGTTRTLGAARHRHGACVDDGMVRVREIMERDVATLDANDTLDLADDVMRLGRVRHFPVMSEGRLVGVLSQRDIARAAPSSLLQLRYDAARDWLARVPVESVMSTELHTIAPDRSLRDAVDLMVRERIGCVPVVDHERLVGLVSETDCLRHLSDVLAVDEERQPLRALPL
jgi:CBS domain-containing membrane protein